MVPYGTRPSRIVQVEAIYYPQQKRGGGGPATSSFYLMVRGTVETRMLVSPVRDAIWSIDPDLPLSDLRSMEEVVARTMVRLTLPCSSW